MVLCANSHENLGGLSHCRVCGLPLLDLSAEFNSLADTIASRTEMGRPSPAVLLVGLGTTGANLVEACNLTFTDNRSHCSYVVIDSDGAISPDGSDGILLLKLGELAQSAGTFCGIGEAITKCDPYLMPTLRRAGLSHKDDNQSIIFITGIGGGIGSAASVLVEKSRELNPNCHTVALAIVPGTNESFHNHLNAYYGLSHLLDSDSRNAADLVITVGYDRMKNIRGVGVAGQELTTDGLLATLSNLFLKNLSPQYLAEVIRINQSVGVKLVVPCLALGRSMEIFGSLPNVLESAIAYPASCVSRQAVLTCHLLLRVPGSQAPSFKEETVNEQLRTFVRRNFPGVKATSLSITYSNEQHDRIEACVLLGGGSAERALFADDINADRFRDEFNRQASWQTYGLSEESVKFAQDAIIKYDSHLEEIRDKQTRRAEKAKDIVTKPAPGTRRRG